jgi:hypothetical protein
MTTVSALSHIKHIAVDGTAGFLIGGIVDHLFSMVNAQAPTDARNTALLVAKIMAQMFVNVSVGYGVSEGLYPGGATDDVTGGFAMMWTMFQASPNMRRDLQGLSELYQNWMHEYLDNLVKEVHTSTKNA